MACSEIIPVRFARETQYKIRIDHGGLLRVKDILHDANPHYSNSHYYLLTDKTVDKHHSPSLQHSFNERLPVICLSPGERLKTLSSAIKVYDALLKMHFKRRDVLIGMGGGAVCDLTGFIASTFMRGVQYYLLPTSLVAQIDAAIGGKVGVNLSQAKNIIGSFYHPSGILVDSKVLATLPKKEIRNGLSEMIKTAIIASESLFAFVEKNWPLLFRKQIFEFDEAIRETIKIKLALLADDPFESNLKRQLNFGHAIAHSLETIFKYKKISHGEAVSIGMAIATKVALHKGTCSAPTAVRILAVLQNIGLPTNWPIDIDPNRLTTEMQKIMSIRNGHLYFVVPQAIGQTVIDETITIQDILSVIQLG